MKQNGTPAPNDVPLLQARGIRKSFGHVEALNNVNFTVHEGEIVGLIGDNGAGKSTLVKILSGALSPDAGELILRGATIELPTPASARAAGIETVYQDLALADDLDATANLFLGREVRRQGILGRLGFLDKRQMRQAASGYFASLGVALPPGQNDVARLSGGQRQGVAVARAMTWASRVVIMDEPTAALGVVQTEAVRKLILKARENGLSIVLVSHSMPEVLQVADRIEVLRLGRRVAALQASETNADDLVAAMTGSREFT
jgi:simple sugar transport system ATP-binding protein